MENIETEAYLSDLDFFYDGVSDIHDKNKYIGAGALITLSIPFNAAQKIMCCAANDAVRHKETKFKIIFEPIKDN